MNNRRWVAAIVAACLIGMQAVTGVAQTTPPTAPISPVETLDASDVIAADELSAEATAEAQPQQPCANLLRSVLIVNARGRVSYEDPRDPLNIRSAPGTFAEISGIIQPGGIFYVLEGPECTARYTWYRVEYRLGDSDLITGWIAEGDASVHYVERYPPN
jgi:hypothetical protein